MIENKEIEILSNDPFKVDNVLEDFGCSLSEENSKKGRLYLNDRCIGFSSEDKERDVFLNFNEIKQIILNGENIEIETHKENKINFFSFDDFNSAFNKINSIFKLYNENELKEEKNFSSDSADSNNDNDDVNKRSPSSKFSLNSNASIDTSSSSSKNIVSLEGNDSKPLKEAQSTENIKKLVLEEENDDSKLIIKNNSSNDLKKNINILDLNKKEEKDEKQIIPEKIVFTKMDPNLDYEICKKIIDLPPKEFFEKYMTNKNPETSYEAYYKWVGEYSSINVQNWEKIGSKDKKVVEKYQRKESFCLALHNVPLINKSNVEKICTYWIENDGTYYMHTLSKSNGVPLSSHFTVETFSEFHPFMNNTKTVFRTYVRTNIIKWTMFKMALISQGKKSYNQEVEKWLQFISEKGDKIDGDYCV